MNTLNATAPDRATVRATLTAIGNITGRLSLPVGSPEYTGAYDVRPAIVAQTLQTAGLRMARNVTIEEIPVSDVDNAAGGVTLTIGGI